MASFEYRLPTDVPQAELLALVAALNNDDAVDGILVQLPLPPQIDAEKVLRSIDPAKDVDGFHPINVGRLWSGLPSLVPCTPQGCLLLLRTVHQDLTGAEAVVLGRSNIVGKPVAALLLAADCTVTVAHSKSREAKSICRRADILIAAIGRAGMVTRDYVKPGATVIDVGINRITDRKDFDRFFPGNKPGNKKREETFLAKGSTLVGDVHPEVAEIAGAITPVPGGVGPLTIAMLMANSVKAAMLRRGREGQR
jgi:methylenetetrahydrofolate dehydrogenase (NADP+)/methenyltetrahydrofolate cyclohydrolase